MQRREFLALMKTLGIAIAASPLITACGDAIEGYELNAEGVYEPKRLPLQSEVIDGQKFFLFRDMAITHYSSPYIGNDTKFQKSGQAKIQSALSVYDMIEKRDIKLPFAIGGSHNHTVLIGEQQYQLLVQGKGTFARTTETEGHFHVVYIDPEFVTDVKARPIYVAAK